MIFTLLFWWLVALSYGNHQPGEPKPDTLLIDICTVFAFLALPLSVIATLLGMIALIKGQQMRHAACGLIIAMPLSILLGMGLWMAVNGGG
ncbi:MAG: hypothetical protein QGG88_09780 [Gammaproteobacteria bacterium]|nr:hypothetical protein [Gammaproteobacteria bacterium]